MSPVRVRADAYLLLGLVFGALWLALIGLYIGGVFGTFVPFGIATVVTAQLLLRPVGTLERRLVVSLLGHPVPAPPPLRFKRSARPLVNAVRRSAAVFKDGHSWRVLAWILLRTVTGPLGFLAVAGRFVLPVVLVLTPVAVLVDTLSDGVSIGLAGRYWLLLVPVGLVVVPALRTGGDALADLHRRLAGWALGPGRGEIAAALARAAQAEEQVRIDQELHDSIGHMLSMIVVQAGAGAHVFDRDPDFARRALRTIEQRGRAALGELDRIISGMHGNQVEPLPDVGSLPALVAGAREAGVDVVERIRVGEVPASLGRGAYRIVQEALTNAAKHAPGGSVRVDVAGNEVAVALSVVNELRGVTPTPDRASGRGLASIRDRATLLGGAASIGVTDEGEFAVHAVLPIGAVLPDGATTGCTLGRPCACLGCAIRREILDGGADADRDRRR